MSAGPAQSAATRRALPITITLLVVLMFFPPKYLGWVGWFGDLATVVTAPISHPSTKFATWIDPARDDRDDATLEQLREDRDTAMYQAQAAQEQVRELERIIRDLQGSIEYIEQRNVTPLFASVIGASADLSSRNLTVKRGANAGVQPNTVAVVRAALPFLVRPRDLALHLPNLEEAQARALLRSGFAGPPLLVGGEPVVSRDSLVEAIERWASTGIDVLDGLPDGSEARS